MKMTAEQRYRQAMTLSRRLHHRSVADLIAGKARMEMCGMDRDRACLIREIGRAYDAGFAAGRSALQREGE